MRRVQSSSKSSWEGPWEYSGRLRRSQSSSERSWGVLGGPRGDLGRSFGLLGGSLGVPWAGLGGSFGGSQGRVSCRHEILEISGAHLQATRPVVCRDGLPVGVTSRLHFQETYPELLKELLRGSLGVLGETYEISELLGEVLGRTGWSSGGPWEVLWAPWGVPWGPLGGSGRVLRGLTGTGFL